MKGRCEIASRWRQNEPGRDRKPAGETAKSDGFRGEYKLEGLNSFGDIRKKKCVLWDISTYLTIKIMTAFFIIVFTF